MLLISIQATVVEESKYWILMCISIRSNSVDPWITVLSIYVHALASDEVINTVSDDSSRRKNGLFEWTLTMVFNFFASKCEELSVRCFSDASIPVTLPPHTVCKMSRPRGRVPMPLFLRSGELWSAFLALPSNLLTETIQRCEPLPSNVEQRGQLKVFHEPMTAVSYQLSKSGNFVRYMISWRTVSLRADSVSSRLSAWTNQYDSCWQDILHPTLQWLMWTSCWNMIR